MTNTDKTESDDHEMEFQLDQARAKANVIKMWNEREANKPVKVMPIEATDRQSVSGYFTMEKFVRGRTPYEMEKELGLESGSLKNGATIYELTENPEPDQFELHGYNQIPGIPGYPKGPGIPEWRLTEEVPAKVIGKVGPGERWENNYDPEKFNDEVVQSSKTASELSKHSSQPMNDVKGSTSTQDPSDEYYQGYGY